jgi:DNA uptake protein ComE-like DNA-binding protein
MNRIILRAALAVTAVLAVSVIAAADTSSTDAPPAKKININQASAKDFSNLPRIGTKVASGSSSTARTTALSPASKI